MVENYTVVQWIAFFYIYSFLGWCIESTIVSVSRRRLTNRGFLTGPILPLYGSGALVILLSTLWVRDSFALVYICGMIAATGLEYATGIIMEAMFNMRYWDYTGKKFNLNGYICLKSSLFWGVLSVALVCYIHVPIAEFICSMQPVLLNVLVAAVLAAAVTDTVFAFRKAFDLQKMLAYETKLKQELADLQAHISEIRDTFTERTTEKQRAYMQKQEERERYLSRELADARGRAEKFKDSILKRFPSATSKKFGEALNGVKGRFNLQK